MMHMHTKQPRFAAPADTRFVLLAALALTACSAPNHDDAKENANGPHAEKRSKVVTGESTGSLARVDLSPTHSVEFWQSRDGHVAVLEDYDVDLDLGSTLEGFRARRDSYAELYLKLAGDEVDLDVLEQLRAADARPMAERSPGQESTLERPTTIGQGRQSEDGATAATRGKSVADDWLWFEGQICIPRQQQANEDESFCDGEALAPNGVGWVQDWHVDDYETSNVALFNAHDSDTAHLTSLGTTCGFLELGLCSGLVFKEITADPRHVVTLINESDDGFDIHATGTIFGVHYLFWD